MASKLKLNLATKHREAGVEHFKNAEYQRAFDSFSSALEALPPRENGYDTMGNETPKTPNLAELWNACQSNRAMAASKLERWEDVVADCNAVVGGGIARVENKYILRCVCARAKALEQLGQVLLAVNDWRVVMTLPNKYTEAMANLRRVYELAQKNATKVSWTHFRENPAYFEPRMFHTTVLHPDQTSLVVFGGCNRGKLRFESDSECDSTIVHLFDFASPQSQQRWTTKVCTGAFPTKFGLCYHSAVVYGRCMYVYGGEFGYPEENPDSYKEVTCDVLALDLDTFVWTKVPVAATSIYHPTQARERHTAVVHGTKMYVFGFRESDNNMECFDFVDRTWEVCKTVDGVKPPGREKHMSWVWGNTIAIYGGETNDDESSIYGTAAYDLWLYDLEECRWREIKNPKSPGARVEAQACVLAPGITDVVVTFGGYIEASCGSLYLNSGIGFQQLKPSEKLPEGGVKYRVLYSAEEDADSNNPGFRAGSTMTAVGNTAYLVGGYNSMQNEVHGDVWKMKVKSNKKKSNPKA